MDARKLYKGAAGVRKGQAMLAWLGEVGEALTEVGDLGKTMEKLREQVVLAQGVHDTFSEKIKILRGEHTGAEAEARKILADADAQAAEVAAKAMEEGDALLEKVRRETEELRDTVEADWAIHRKAMAEAGAKEIVLHGKVAKLTEELAAIKARL